LKSILRICCEEALQGVAIKQGGDSYGAFPRAKPEMHPNVPTRGQMMNLRGSELLAFVL
jgi:hypothetical protein